MFDQRWYVQFTAILNILRMVFICLVLALGVYLINQDAVRLVLRPIERMLRKVRGATWGRARIRSLSRLSRVACS